MALGENLCVDARLFRLGNSLLTRGLMSEIVGHSECSCIYLRAMERCTAELWGRMQAGFCVHDASLPGML